MSADVDFQRQLLLNNHNRVAGDGQQRRHKQIAGQLSGALLGVHCLSIHSISLRKAKNKGWKMVIALVAKGILEAKYFLRKDSTGI